MKLSEDIRKDVEQLPGATKHLMQLHPVQTPKAEINKMLNPLHSPHVRNTESF